MNDDIHNKVDRFFSSYAMVRYPKDQILIFPDESSERIFYIISGLVCQYDISYRGDEVIVNTFKPPSFFPVSMAINKAPNRFFFKTETETILRIAPAQDVVKFLHDAPDVTYDLLSRVCSGVDSILERMIHLMSGTAKSRLIFELIVEFRRFGASTGNSGYLDVNEGGLASRSGLSRETVSREIKHLKEKGLVEVRSRKLFVADLSALEKLLGAHI